MILPDAEPSGSPRDPQAHGDAPAVPLDAAPRPARARTPDRRARGEGFDLYRLLVESVRDYAIFALDPDGYVMSWNDGAQRLKGYSADEIIGRHFSTFYPPERTAEGFPDHELAEAARLGRFEDEGWRVRKDGTRFWANVVITALFDGGGTLVGFAKVTRDLTERRVAQEQAIADARRLAAVEASSRTKSEFLAAMSHELRTPLNAIGGYAELIELGVDGPVTEAQVDHLQRIRASQQHLLRIISDLLNYSRVESGQVEYAIGPVSIRAVIDAVLPMIEPQAAVRGLALDRGTHAESLVAWADRGRAEQILLNLLSNATKFTPPGGRVVVTSAARDGRVLIAVRDTGPGVPPEKQAAIFEPFVQLGRSLTSGHEGTGLGLAISRDLARAMGGELTVESEPGCGATFTLYLPAG
ncbi:MAG: PAS domain-containing sensor histidine kinase [Gemmatirosa sp.]|nr:PAS domain-containing sensor histidine kinase [Gemmatirosa sp.]